MKTINHSWSICAWERKMGKGEERAKKAVPSPTSTSPPAPPPRGPPQAPVLPEIHSACASCIPALTPPSGLHCLVMSLCPIGLGAPRGQGPALSKPQLCPQDNPIHAQVWRKNTVFKLGLNWEFFLQGGAGNCRERGKIREKSWASRTTYQREKLGDGQEQQACRRG